MDSQPIPDSHHSQINRLITFIKSNNPSGKPLPKHKKKQHKTLSLTSNKKLPKANEAVNQFLQKKGVIHEKIERGYARKMHSISNSKQIKSGVQFIRNNFQIEKKIALFPSIKAFKTQTEASKHKIESLLTEGLEKISPEKTQTIKYDQSFLLSRKRYLKQSQEAKPLFLSKQVSRKSFEQQRRTECLIKKKDRQIKAGIERQSKYSGWEVSNQKQVLQVPNLLWIE